MRIIQIAAALGMAAATSLPGTLSPPFAQAADVCPAYGVSGPITVTRNGQVIHDLVITSTSGPAIFINGFSGVQIANVVIHHDGGAGIALASAPSVSIRNADIVFDGAPQAGANPSSFDNNIDCYASPGLVVSNVRLTRGSSGIFLNQCNGSKLTNIEGHDQRGPFPRGQLVQWANATGGSIAHFSDENSLANSWTEDNVNVYESSGITISDGLVDTNNSPSGDGVIADYLSHDVLVSGVDAVHQGNGCFGIYGGGEANITFSHTRCSSNYCTLPRGNPLSGSLAWSVDPTAITGNLNIKASSYAGLCNPGNLVWDATKLSVVQLHEAAFTPRPPLRVHLCKYAY